MLTVTTYAELEAAVLRDETYLRLEGAAKQYYEQRLGDTMGGGLIGALPGLLVGGPIGLAAGALIGASVGARRANQSAAGHKDVATFLLRYYRKTSSGVTYIELTHR